MIIPAIRKHVIETVWTLKSKSPLLRYWKVLEKSQWLPENTLKELQWTKFKNLIAFVWDNNPYYRMIFSEYGVTPNTIKSIDDIQLLPILSKNDIWTHSNDIISNNYNTPNLMHAKTGGSTGKPVMVYFTEECSERRNACTRRHNRWSGWDIGEPVGALWGSPKLPQGVREKLKHWLIEPCIYLDTIKINENSVRTFQKEWNHIRPTLLFGHAHSIFILANYIEAMVIKEINPKAIISSSMMLIPHERDQIEKVFGVTVTDRYGCEEVGLIASECEKHEGMHLNIEHLMVEFLNSEGRHVYPGEEGNIVVTDLENRAMPFIRYQIEDVGVPSDRRCSCGRGLPLMERVTGRTADFLLRKDGSIVAGISLIEKTLTAIKGISQMQIIQDSLDQFVVNIATSNGHNRQCEKELWNELTSIFGRDIHVTINYVPDIPAEISGKYRFAINRVNTNLN